MVAGLGQGEYGQRLGRLAAGHGQGADATFERGDPFFEHLLGGVHDAGVDVARLCQAEQGGGVLGVAEDVAGGLVDGYGAGPGRRVRRSTGVDLTCLETLGLAHGAPSGESSGVAHQVTNYDRTTQDSRTGGRPVR